MKLINSKLTILLTLAFTFTAPSFSSAHNGDQHDDRPRRDRVQTQTITLDRQDLRTLNQDGRLGLKRAIMQKSDIQINENTQLVSVKVTGHARGGMAIVSLNIDGRSVDSEQLGRHRRHDHHTNHHDRDDRRRRRPSLTTILLTNNSRSSDGRWVLVADQDARINNIVITIKKQQRDRDHEHGRLRTVSLGTAKATKIIGRSKTFQAGYKNVKQVLIKAHSNNLDIGSVIVYYSNGQAQRLTGLNGYLAQNRTKAVRINSHHQVQKIVVQANSNNLHGSTARIEVLLGVSKQTRPRPKPRHN